MRITIKVVGLVNRKKVEKQVLSRHSERPASFFSSSFCVPFVSANSVYQSERGNCCAAIYTAGVFAFNKNLKKDQSWIFVFYDSSVHFCPSGQDLLGLNHS